MSKEQAIRFMLLTKRDEELKRKYHGIMDKYEGKNLTEEEQEKIILEEVMPLANSMEFVFSTGDFQELLQSVKKQLTDEELDEAVGGSGQFSLFDNEIYTCELAPDDETFWMYYFDISTRCPNYEYDHIYPGDVKGCVACKHLKIKR